MTPGRRLALALARKGWSQDRLAKELGIPQPTISKMANDQMIGRPHLPRIAELLDVPVEWITTGHPPQPWEDPVIDTGFFRLRAHAESTGKRGGDSGHGASTILSLDFSEASVPADVIADIIDSQGRRHVHEVVTLKLEGRGDAEAQALSEAMHYANHKLRENAVSYDPHVITPARIPEVAHAAAGHGGALVQDFLGDFYSIPDDTLCIRVRGDSASDKIEDGQRAMLAPRRRQPQPSDMVAVCTNDGCSYLKRWYPNGQTVTLVSINSRYPPVVLRLDEIASVRVVAGVFYETI